MASSVAGIPAEGTLVAVGTLVVVDIPAVGIAVGGMAVVGDKVAAGTVGDILLPFG